jgi:cell pole-organizing protein PopZ
MNDPKPQQEPSMEEILASIRKIIAEDEKPAPEDQEIEEQTEESPDDVLDLTEVIEEQEEPAAEMAAVEEQEKALEDDADPAADVQESQEPGEDAEPDETDPMSSDDEPVSEQVSEEIDEPVGEEIDFEAPVDRSDEEVALEFRDEGQESAKIEVETPADLTEEAALPVDEPAPAESGSSLIGEPARAAATGSLASLVHAVDQAKGGAALGDANRTIEDLVKEVMRPMIREWLDENLPGIVDRLVRREVERLSRTAEGDD